MHKKKFLCGVWSLFLAISLIVPLGTFRSQAANVIANKTVVLFTNDVHCGIDDKIGYAGLAGYKNYLEGLGNTVILVDAGDAVQGGSLGTLTKGEALVDIMVKTGYEIAVPGNHEFDYGMDQFMKLTDTAQKSGLTYLSSNFTKTDGTQVFDAYKIIEVNGVKIGFVGITTPESFTKSTPAYFQDDKGNYLYSFAQGNNGKDLYAAVQKGIDGAAAAGADYIVAIGHTGDDKQSSPWTTDEIIANTKGLDAYIDGHSHSVVEGAKVRDKAGNEVLKSQTGTKLDNIGQLVIDGAHSIMSLVHADDLAAFNVEADQEVAAFIDAKKAEFEELLNEKVFYSEVDLNTHDLNNHNVRVIRNTPTNLGDLCADAYRIVLGADIGFMNGGGIRTAISKGDVTYGDVINVFPFNNAATMIKATGQQILDALELSVAAYPQESGGFLHVSGITYELHSYLESSVVLNDKKEFIRVDGEYRIKNVKVNGEALDLEKIYTVGSHNYMLKSGGDGFTMFKGSEIVKDEIMLDNALLIQYIFEYLNGIITAKDYGTVKNTMKLVTEKPKDHEEVKEPQLNDSPATGDVMPSVYGWTFVLSAVMLVLCKKRYSEA